MRLVALSSALVSLLAASACVDSEPHIETTGVAIVGGEPVPPEQMRATLALLAFDETGTVPIGGCTATLIAPRVVLTASHCVRDGAGFGAPVSADRVLVNRGTLDLTTFTVEGQIFAAQQIFVHPLWSVAPAGFIAHDVAIVTLQTPIEGVTPALIPGLDVAGRQLVPGEPIVEMGYGLKSNEGAPDLSLHQVEVPQTAKACHCRGHIPRTRAAMCSLPSGASMSYSQASVHSRKALLKR